MLSQTSLEVNLEPLPLFETHSVGLCCRTNPDIPILPVQPPCAWPGNQALVLAACAGRCGSGHLPEFALVQGVTALRPPETEPVFHALQDMRVRNLEVVCLVSNGQLHRCCPIAGLAASGGIAIPQPLAISKGAEHQWPADFIGPLLLGLTEEALHCWVAPHLPRP